MGTLALFDYLLVIVGGFGYAYQFFCIVVGWFGKPKVYDEAAPNHLAVIISARNETAVIGTLLDSIAAQNYSKEHLDVWVCADNCTDETAQLCRDKGAYVVERFNQDAIGKGYALSYLFDNMRAGTLGESKEKRDVEEIKARQALYKGFLVFDADNILDVNYVKEMNNVFAAGNQVVTSYRNSKNFSSNWISSGSALWFIRESRLLNNSRSIVGVSCHVGGTGFMFSREIMERNDGWKHHLLTEDLEFTMDCVLHGNKVAYCGKAELFDEQPITFSQSWNQRLRWSKGFLQVFSNYGTQLIRRAIREGDFSCLDLTVLIFPWVVLMVLRIIVGSFYVAMGFVSFDAQLASIAQSLFVMVVGALICMAMAALTCILEWRKIGATKKELFGYVITFPLFILSYFPISFVAIFSKVEWKPIQHGNS
jgi:cellulose synthase/poly-beta-1,6-N-acetylglucosamine synthase-like glycosyltransferase